MSGTADHGLTDPRKMLKVNEWRKYGDKMIFKSTMNALIQLDKMKKVYAEKGIDMYLNGKKTVISK